MNEVGDALREVQQVLALFQAPESDLRPTVDVIPQRGAGSPVKMQNPPAGTIWLSGPPADLRRAASPDRSAPRCGAPPLSKGDKIS